MLLLVTTEVKNGDYLSPIFKLLYSCAANKFEVKKSQEARLGLRLARMAIIGESISNWSFTAADKSDYNLDREAISALIELYIFYARAVYDSGMLDLKDLYSKDFPQNYQKFYRKYKEDTGADLPKWLDQNVKEDKLNFSKLRDIRNAIKNLDAQLSIVSDRGLFYVVVEGKKVSLKEDLRVFVFEIAFSVWILLSPSLHGPNKISK